MSPEGDAPIIAIGITVRWVHLALSLLIFGALAMLILAGRSDRPTARAWEARVLRTSGWLLLGVLASGLAALAQHAAVLSGHAGAAIDPAVLLRVLLETHWGLVWLTRHGILVLLAALLAVRLDVERPLDWRAARGEAALLASVALGLLAAAGHAAAVEPGTALAIGADAVHLLASGLWLGGLLPLAALLTAAAREGGADSRPYAVLAARRGSVPEPCPSRGRARASPARTQGRNRPSRPCCAVESRFRPEDEARGARSRPQQEGVSGQSLARSRPEVSYRPSMPW